MAVYPPNKPRKEVAAVTVVSEQHGVVATKYLFTSLRLYKALKALQTKDAEGNNTAMQHYYECLETEKGILDDAYWTSVDNAIMDFLYTTGMPETELHNYSIAPAIIIYICP